MKFVGNLLDDVNVTVWQIMQMFMLISKILMNVLVHFRNSFGYDEKQ